MRHWKKLVFAALAGLALVLGATAPAFARALEAERRAGLVGDQADGFMGVVSPNAPPEVVRKVQEVNAERRAYYAERAKARGTSVEVVGVIFAQQLYAETKSGEYFRDQNGVWVKKP